MKNRILYVFGGEKASGAEIVIRRLIEYQSDIVEPHIFVANGDFGRDLVNKFGQEYVHISKYLNKTNRDNNSYLKYFFLVVRNHLILPFIVLNYCISRNIKFVHANTLSPSSYMLLGVCFEKVFIRQISWMWSDHDLSHYGKLDRAASKLCGKLFDRTLVVSEAVKKKYSSNSKVNVLYNGLDITQFELNDQKRKMFRERYNVNNDDIVFAIIGMITERKGQLELLDVFSHLHSEYKNVKLFIAGFHLEEVYSERFFKRVPQLENVHYLGHLSDLSDLYNGVDCVINNSNISGSEPLGTTIYEAMAYKRIVLASDVGGSPEIVDHLVNGIIFIPEDETALLNAMRMVIINYQDYVTSLAEQAKQKVFEKFNISVMSKKYLSILNELNGESTLD